MQESEVISKIFQIANNAIYFRDSTDYLTALFEICEVIKPGDETIGEEYIEDVEDALEQHQAQQEKDFIVVFGGRDKLGKTTVANIICEQFPELGFSYRKFPNPDLFSGQQLRLILQGKLPFESASFQALNYADKMLTPLQGRLIVDRYTESADVFGKADGLPAEWVDMLNSSLQQPDLTFIFTGEPFGTDGEHYDGNSKIAEGYVDFLERNKDNKKLIEIKANRPIQEVVAEIIEAIKRFDNR